MRKLSQKFEQMVGRLTEFFLKHKLKSLLAVAMLFALCAQIFATNFSNVDNSLGVWFDHKSEAYQKYQDFIKDFGHDRYLMIIMDVGDAFSPQALTLTKTISQKLKTHPHITNVVSLTEQNQILSQNDEIKTTPLFDTIPTDPETLKAKQDWALQQNNIVRLLISDDRHLSVIIAYMNNPDDIQNKRETFLSIQNLVKSLNTTNVPVYYSGVLANEVTFNDLTQNNQQTFLVGMILVIAAVIYVFFRSAYTVFLPLILMAVCITITQALFFKICGSLNIVTGMIGPILMAASIADAVHAILGYQEWRQHGLSMTQALIRNAREISIPCFFTALTTFAGFISFNVSPIVPNQQLGYFAAFGVMLAYVLTLFLIPLMISLFGHKTLSKNQVIMNDQFTQRLLEYSYRIVTKHKTFVLAIFAVAALLSFWGMSLVKIETNSLKYFPPDNPQRIAGELVESDLAGSGTFDIVLQSENLDQPAATDPQLLKAIDIFSKTALTNPTTTKVFGYPDWIKSLNKAWHNNDPHFDTIPETREEIAQLLFIAESSGSDFLSQYKTIDNKKIRLTIKCLWKSSEELNAYADEILGMADGIFKPLGASAHGTGQSYMWIQLDNYLLKTEFMSFSLATVLVVIMMILIMRSIKAGFITLIPNILPIFMAIGAMGFLKIHLNLATVMTAGVAIGITVDDSIHYLVKFKKVLHQLQDYPLAIAATNKTIGTAVIFNSVILTAGFLVLCLSSFSPSRYFGAVTALTLFLSIFCEILLMPLLLLIFKPFPLTPKKPEALPSNPELATLETVFEG